MLILSKLYILYFYVGSTSVVQTVPVTEHTEVVAVADLSAAENNGSYNLNIWFLPPHFFGEGSENYK